jgi:hypothetical protein
MGSTPEIPLPHRRQGRAQVYPVAPFAAGMPDLIIPDPTNANRTSLPACNALDAHILCHPLPPCQPDVHQGLMIGFGGGFSHDLT